MSSGVVGSNNLPGNNPERAVKPAAPLLWGQGQIVGYRQRSGRVTNKGNGTTHKLYDNFSSISIIAA
jgi:hypothetical protein